MSNDEPKEKVVIEVRELSHEEIVEIARRSRRLRQKLQEEINRIERIPPDAWDFRVD